MPGHLGIELVSAEIAVQTGITDESGRLVAQTTQSQAVLAPRSV